MEKTINRADSLSISTTANPFGWIRGGSFDSVFILGVTALALLSGWLSVANPRLFPVILFLDLWFLAYHHVIATFARLAFDIEHDKEHKFLVTWLPVIVVAATATVAFTLGSWMLATLYLYWQWFHYTRQAYGISRMYYRKANPAHTGSSVLEQLTIYTVPLYGILYLSWQSPDTFLGMRSKFLPTPYWAVSVVGIASVVIVAWWLINQFIEYQKGKMKPGYTLFMMSHLVVFMTGYIFIKDINYGWLCLNIWHNAQYVMLVWDVQQQQLQKRRQPSSQISLKHEPD